MNLRLEVIAILFALSMVECHFNRQETGLPLSNLRTPSVSSLNPFKAVRNWWRGDKDEKVVVPLDKYPLWKVHKYNGISIRPVSVVDAPTSEISAGPVPDKYGSPPPVVTLPHFSYSAPNKYELLPQTEYDPPKLYSPPMAAYEQPKQSYRPPPPPPEPMYEPPTPYKPPQESFTPHKEYGAPQTDFVPPSETNGEDFNSQSGESDSNGGQSEGDTASALSALDNLAPLASLLPEDSSSGGNGGGGGPDLAALADLAKLAGGLDLKSITTLISSLPEGSIEKIVSLFGLARAKNNKERIKSLLDVVSAGKKLSASAVQSLSKVLQEVVMGNDGDSSDVALESGIYKNVPPRYPGRKGLLPRLPIFSATARTIPLPSLPEPPPLPYLPFFDKAISNKISVPKLPFIQFPEKYNVPNLKAKGPYVSFRFPKPATLSDKPQLEQPSTTPVPEYYPPPPQPTPTYPSPSPSPTPTYGPPTLKSIYGSPQQPQIPFYVPSPAPIPVYSPPSHTIIYQQPPAQPSKYLYPMNSYSVPSTSYGVPVQATYSAQVGDVNSFQPSPENKYGVPNNEYSVPQEANQPQIPQSEFVLPEDNTQQAAHSEYGVPENDISSDTDSDDGVPQENPSPVFDTEYGLPPDNSISSSQYKEFYHKQYTNPYPLVKYAPRRATFNPFDDITAESSEIYQLQEEPMNRSINQNEKIEKPTRTRTVLPKIYVKSTHKEKLTSLPNTQTNSNDAQKSSTTDSVTVESSTEDLRKYLDPDHPASSQRMSIELDKSDPTSPADESKIESENEKHNEQQES